MGESEAKLPLTERIASLVKEGKKEQAIAEHNANVKRQLARAEAGETINLSDLMASKETLEEYD